MTFDLNFWIGISGVIATFVFGVLSIYLVKVRRYPGHLTFIQEQIIGLFDSIVKNFPQISITYDTKNID